MATAVHTTRASGIHSRSMQHLVIGWMLMLPLVFFAVHGNFSFEKTAGDTAAASSLSGLASTGRSLGFLGYVVIPGIAYSIVLWLIVTNGQRILSMAWRMKMLTLLAFLTICSAAWSQDSFRSAYNGTFYFIGTLFAFYLVVKFDPDELQSIVMMLGACVIVLSFIMLFLFPQFAVVHGYLNSGAWTGVFVDRTSAAKCLVFLLSPALTLRRERSLRRMTYISLLSILIFMAYAMTARFVVLAYMILMVFIRIYVSFGRRSALLLGAAFLLVVVLVVWIGLPYVPLVLEGVGKDATLTGRTVIWPLVLRSIAKRPFLGYGFYAFWQGLSGESAHIIVAANWIFGYAHNGILELWLQLGLLGVAVFFVTLFQAIKDAWFCLRNGCPRHVDWYIGLIALTIMYNIDEATVVFPNELLSILYVVACCGLAMTARRLREIKTIEALYT